MHRSLLSTLLPALFAALSLLPARVHGQTCVPSPEVCDGLDNNCDGLVDNGLPSAPCIPPSTPPGLVFGGVSRCRQGATQCSAGFTLCVGFQGPSAEVCDGVDNNCNGLVDDGVPGLGASCGSNMGACRPGTTQCVSGAPVCVGNVGPSPELCDGVDNDCNGLVDDGALADSPPSGSRGCWAQAGNCCSFTSTATGRTTSWCPPAGATCNGAGALTAPCAAATLACVGGAWVCSGGRAPAREDCDGVDNDCNGLVDDNVPGLGAACGSTTAPCTAGTTACVGGAMVCMGGVRPAVETCNCVDDDCDGVADNAPVGASLCAAGESCETRAGRCGCYAPGADASADAAGEASADAAGEASADAASDVGADAAPEASADAAPEASADARATEAGLDAGADGGTSGPRANGCACGVGLGGRPGGGALAAALLWGALCARRRRRTRG